MSTLLIIFISIIRYLAIKHPIKNLLTIKRVIFTVLLLGAVSLSLVMFYTYNQLYSGNTKLLSSSLCTLLGNSDNHTANKIISGCVSVILLISTIIIIFVYAELVRVKRQSAKAVGNESKDNNTTQDNSVTVYLAVVSLTNALCLFPAGLFYMTAIFIEKYPIILHQITLLLILPINPILNPILFNISIIKKQLRSLSDLLYRRICTWSLK